MCRSTPARARNPECHLRGHPVDHLERHAHIAQGRHGVAPVLVAGDQAVVQMENADALKAAAPAVVVLRCAGVAEQPRRIADLLARHRIAELPEEIPGVAPEDFLDHVADRGPAVEFAVEDIVVDAVLGEKRGQRLAVAHFDGGGEILEKLGKCGHGKARTEKKREGSTGKTPGVSPETLSSGGDCRHRRAQAGG